MTAVELKLDFKLPTDTQYSALSGELWSVYCRDLEGNWHYYNGTALYYDVNGGNGTKTND